MTGNGEGRPSDPMQALWTQMRSMAEQFNRVYPGAFGVGGGATPASPLSALPTMLALPPMPGAMTAAQLRSIAATVAAQRSAIATMEAQLDAFDTQLESLESMLEPLLTWSETWAEAEKSFTPPAAEPPEPAP